MQRRLIFDFFHKIAVENKYLMLRNRDTKVQEKIKRMMQQSTEFLGFLQKIDNKISVLYNTIFKLKILTFGV